MERSVTSNAIKFGIIGGLIFVTVHMVGWSFGTTTYVSVVSIENFVPYLIGLFLFAGFQERKMNGGFIPFKDALKFIFLAYVIVALMEAISNYVLYNILDKDLTAKMLEITRAKTIAMMEKFGADEKSISEAMSKVDADSKKTSIKNIFLGTGFNLIWYFIKSLLLALIIRKEPKLEDTFAPTAQ